VIPSDCVLKPIVSFTELEREEEAKDSTVIPDEPLVAEYYEYRQQLDQMGQDFRDVITHPTYSLPFLQPGRLVKVKHQKLDFGWGVIINYSKRLPPKVRESQFRKIDPNVYDMNRISQ
jgi:ATP-dependent RNA helicase DOB1